MSHVMSVRFLFDDSHVISAGGNDCSLFQWLHSPDPLFEAEQQLRIFQKAEDGPGIEKFENLVNQLQELRSLDLL